jgi:hypothetical protein
LLIEVVCEDSRFSVQAWDHEQPTAYVCSGMTDPESKALLNEILGKIQAKFPFPINLCIRDAHDIVRQEACVPAHEAAPPASSCVINVNNGYIDGSQIEGSCAFIYTTDVGQIEVVRGAKAASAGSTLTFNQPAPGRVGAYRVDVVRRKNGKEERIFACNVAESGQGIGKEEVWFPPRINVNRASRSELEQISGIGPATSQAIVDAQPFQHMDDLVKVVASVLGASKAAGLELERKVVLA